MSAVIEHTPQPQSEVTALIQAIERAAINPAVDVEKMERLFALQERMLARNAEMSFNASFAEMQNKLPIIKENGEIWVGEVLRSTYATFEDINEAVKPILSAHGFAISFRTDFGEGICVTCILMHSQGHREQTSMKLPADTSGGKGGVQAIASSVSYAKRYTENAILNLTTRGEDDDGQAATAGADMAAVQKFVSRFTDAFNADVEEPEKAALVYAIHTELAGNNDVYIAVGNLLGTTRKNAIRKYVDQHKAIIKELKSRMQTR